MPYYTALLLAFVIVSSAAPAAASAWVVAEDTTKLIVSLETDRLHYLQSLPSDDTPTRLTRKAKRDSSQLSVEHGLTETWTLTGKVYESRWRIDTMTYDNWQLVAGLHRNTPVLKTSLMPPYLYQAIKKLCDSCHMHRDRPASLEVTASFDHQNIGASNSDAGLTISLADKILVDGFSVMQQVQYGTGGNRLQQWHKWSYRFEVGLGAQWRAGVQNEAFWDRPSAYANLTHGYYLEWHRPDSQMAIILLHGNRRDSSHPHVFDSTKLQLQMMF